jgi:clostripain
MRKTTRSFVTFILLLVLLSTISGTAIAAPAAQAKWTVMVYISGDNNLEDYVVKDLELELAPTGSSANVQVVALADRGPGYDTSYGDWQDTKLFHVTQGMTASGANAVSEAQWIGERNMGDPQTLVDFVNWSKTNYPADHYVLYFWGHGWNWHPGFVMQDDTSDDTLDYEEMKAIIPSLGFIDVVGYDGCNMASIEVFKLWHNHATAVSASQEYVGWDGIEYDHASDGCK